MRTFGPAALLLLVGLLAGCGGGGTTTVVEERTVTERREGAPGQETAKQTGRQARGPRRVLHLRSFRSPSGNVGCVMYEGGARCDIRRRDWAPPPRPSSCPAEVDYGQGLEVSRRGRATFVCAGDTALDPAAAKLAYGTASRRGGAECVSRTAGVTCASQAGHGFFVSVQGYHVF